MKKNVLVLLVVLFGFSNVVYSAACNVSSGITTAPNGSSCEAEPDFFQVKMYKMMLCTSAPTAPTTSSAFVLSNCQSVLQNTSGTDVSVTNGSTSALSGTITRPDNGAYTHGYIQISKDFVIGDTRTYNTSIDDDTDGTADGTTCVTRTSGINCTGLAVQNQTMPMGYNHFGNDHLITGEVVSGGTVDAYLTLSNGKLAANAANDTGVTYLEGVQTFTTPIVITDNTTSMNTSFAVSTGMTISETGGVARGLAPRISVTNGPFSVIMTIQ